MNSITSKILVSILVSISAILCIVAAFSYLILNEEELKSFDQQVLDTNKQLEIIMKDPVFSYDLTALQKIIDSYLPNPLIANLIVKDQKSRLMVSATSKRAVIHTHEIPLYYGEEKLVGTIVVSYSRNKIDAVLADKISEIGINLVTTLGALSLFLTWLIQRILVGPIKRVSKVITDMNSGGRFDLTARAPIEGNDEIGILARSFNDLLTTVEATLVDVKENIELVGKWLGKFEDISGDAGKTTAHQKLITGNALAQVQELQKAISGIVGSTEITAKDCNESLEIANEHKNDVEENLKLVRNLVTELDKNASKSNELKDASRSIGSVLDVIKNIAEQTNLLALNAAIEAARAGESGRGFAVVADEVRTLAQRTQASTSEIESIIDELQIKAHEAYTSTQHGQSLANQAITLTEKSTVSYNYISKKLHAINAKMQDVVVAAEKQRELSNDVNQQMEQVQSGSQDLAHKIQTMYSDSAIVLTAEKELNEDLGKFKFKTAS
jgi:methyl-accepting chemotaxis protein